MPLFTKENRPSSEPRKTSKNKLKRPDINASDRVNAYRRARRRKEFLKKKTKPPVHKLWNGGSHY